MDTEALIKQVALHKLDLQHFEVEKAQFKLDKERHQLKVLIDTEALVAREGNQKQLEDDRAKVANDIVQIASDRAQIERDRAEIQKDRAEIAIQQSALAAQQLSLTQLKTQIDNSNRQSLKDLFAGYLNPWISHLNTWNCHSQFGSIEFSIPKLNLSVHWHTERSFALMKLIDCFFLSEQSQKDKIKHNKSSALTTLSSDYLARMVPIFPIPGVIIADYAPDIMVHYNNGKLPHCGNSTKLFFATEHIQKNQWIQFQGEGSLLSEETIYIGSLLDKNKPGSFTSHCALARRQMTSRYKIFLDWA